MRIRTGGENLVRMHEVARRTETEPGRGTAAPRWFAPRAPAPLGRVPSSTDIVATLCAEGLPNVLHELVHLALAGVVADDHGFDYQAIPVDLDTGEGRDVLFDELACCVVSCAYLLDDDGAASWQRCHAWFREQIGIQPVFYGYEDDAAGFWRRVDAVTAGHAERFAAMLDAAYARCEALLAWGGATSDVARCRRRLDWDGLWTSTSLDCEHSR